MRLRDTWETWKIFVSVRTFSETQGRLALIVSSNTREVRGSEDIKVEEKAGPYIQSFLVSSSIVTVITQGLETPASSSIQYCLISETLQGVCSPSESHWGCLVHTLISEISATGYSLISTLQVTIMRSSSL